MVSRETVLDEYGVCSVFPNRLFKDFAKGASLNQLTADAAALFLCVAANKSKSNIFLSYKNEKAANSIYLLAIGLGPWPGVPGPRPIIAFCIACCCMNAGSMVRGARLGSPRGAFIGFG